MADPLSTTGVIETLADKGLSGVIIIILLFVVRHLDNRVTEREAALKAERDARLEDAKTYRDGIIEANEKVIEVANDVAKVVEHLEKRQGRVG